MRPGVLVALVLAVSGCLAQEIGPEDKEGRADPALTWGLTECAFVIAAVPVEPEALAPHLPEGFSLRPGRLSGLPAGPRASIELDAYRCAGGTWGNATIADMSYGSHYVAVEAPEALREEGYGATFLKWDTLVADTEARAALASLGAPVHDGEARVLLDGARVSASLGFDDGGGFALEGALGAEDPPLDELPFMEFTPRADGGLLRWHARLHDARIASGAGVVTLPEGSWVREVVGADRAPATFIAGVWNLDNADVAPLDRARVS